MFRLWVYRVIPGFFRVFRGSLPEHCKVLPLRVMFFAEDSCGRRLPSGPIHCK